MRGPKPQWAVPPYGMFLRTVILPLNLNACSRKEGEDHEPQEVNKRTHVMENRNLESDSSGDLPNSEKKKVNNWGQRGDSSQLKWLKKKFELSSCLPAAQRE